MTIDVTADVTADDIAHGEAGDCDRCPIARAVGRAMPFTNDITVSDSTVLATVGGIEMIADMPDAARRFVRDFDAARAVAPLSFPLSFKPREGE